MQQRKKTKSLRELSSIGLLRDFEPIEFAWLRKREIIKQLKIKHFLKMEKRQRTSE